MIVNISGHFSLDILLKKPSGTALSLYVSLPTLIDDIFEVDAAFEDLTDLKSGVGFLPIMELRLASRFSPAERFSALIACFREFFIPAWASLADESA